MNTKKIQELTGVELSINVVANNVTLNNNGH